MTTTKKEYNKPEYRTEPDKIERLGGLDHNIPVRTFVDRLRRANELKLNAKCVKSTMHETELRLFYNWQNSASGTPIIYRTETHILVVTNLELTGAYPL